MKICRILSVLLSYPQAALPDAVPEIRQALQAWPGSLQQLEPLLARLAQWPLIELQQDYVASFDCSRRLSLHLFEHIHGESRERGEALLDLLHEYQRHGFEPGEAGTGVCEMPDYLPLFLEFLGQLPAQQAEPLLGEAIDVIGLLGERLRADGSPYAAVFEVLIGLSPVQPMPLAEAPARRMEALLEAVGPGADGSEPLLKPDNSMVQPIHFYR